MPGRLRPKGITVDPFHLVLGAALFLVLGVALGWLTHGYYSVSVGASAIGEPVGMQTRGADDRQIQGYLDHIAEAEAQAALRPGDLSQQEHLGNLYYDLGGARERVGDKSGARQAFLGAIEHYEAVRQGGAASPDLLTDLGTMYFRSDQPQRAVGAYEDAIASDPNHRNAWMNMGVVKRDALGDSAGARQAWERFLEISPAGPQADRVRTWLNQVSVPGG